MFLSPVKQAGKRIALVVCSLTILVLSCQKNLTGEGDIIDPALPPDLTTTIQSSMSGFVTDENNAAVLGATVTAGGTSVTTDKYGYFEIGNVVVIKNAAVVTVNKTGYFKGIKTYIATADKSAFFRIKLLPKTSAGTIDAATGGEVENSGVKVALTAGSVTNVATDAPYSGTVTVAIHWINPVSLDLVKTMPGDLRAIDSLNTLKTLTTFGMASVELTGAGGELLQITAGKTATLTMPIPAGILAAAPATIPLWHFDEAIGLWRQEGFAVKIGSTYQGQVSHFSFWNCDVPANFVQFNCTVRDADGSAVRNALVKISRVNFPSSAAYGYTDSSGYVAGAVPNNEQLLLEILGEYNCSTPSYTQNFTTSNSNVSLGFITIPMTQIATITGTATDCSNAPLVNGYIIMSINGSNTRFPVSNTGTFSFSTNLCTNNLPATFVAQDITSSQQSTPANYTLVSGNNPIGALNACGVSTEEFVNYSIDGTSYAFATPGDTIIQFYNQQTTEPTLDVYAAPANGGSDNEVAFNFSQTGIALNSTQQLTYFRTNLTNDSLTVTTPLPVTITEYGQVGEFISGNFSGNIGSAPVYAITCSFRIRRQR